MSNEMHLRKEKKKQNKSSKGFIFTLWFNWCVWMRNHWIITESREPHITFDIFMWICVVIAKPIQRPQNHCMSIHDISNIQTKSFFAASNINLQQTTTLIIHNKIILMIYSGKIHTYTHTSNRPKQLVCDNDNGTEQTCSQWALKF